MRWLWSFYQSGTDAAFGYIWGGRRESPARNIRFLPALVGILFGSCWNEATGMNVPSQLNSKLKPGSTVKVKFEREIEPHHLVVRCMTEFPSCYKWLVYPLANHVLSAIWWLALEMIYIRRSGVHFTTPPLFCVWTAEIMSSFIRHLVWLVTVICCY